MRFSCQVDGKVVGFYEINAFPGNNQICVSNHAFILPQHRKLGYGDFFHKERLQKMRELGYNLALCTVKNDNHPQKKILCNNGWQRNDESSFLNKETGNECELWSIQL